MGSESDRPTLLDPRGWPRLLWLAVPIGLGRMALPLARGWAEKDGDTTLVTLPEDWIVNAVALAVPCSAAALVVLGVWSRRWFPPVAASVVAGAIGCGLVLFMGARGLSEGTPGSDGRTYVFFHHQIFMGRTAFLARERERNWISRTVEMIEPNQGEFGFCYASLIRPVGASREDTRVTITSDGIVLGMTGSRAHAAARLGQPASMTEAELENLSPFTLLGDSGEGVEQDVAEVVAKVRQEVRAFGPKDCHEWAHPGPEGRGEFGSGIPTEAALLAALASPNPWVRDAARRIVEAGGPDVYPEAIRMLPPR